MDYDKKIFPSHFSNSFAVRYMFSMDYYENIIIHLEKTYGIGNVETTIYTEQMCSEEIVERFENRLNTKVALGTNRQDQNFNLVHTIFQDFVKADILVCSNSSFSVMCSYFRKDRTTIYHPHLQLRHLPKPNYIPTSESGEIDTKLLPKISERIKV